MKKKIALTFLLLVVYSTVLIAHEFYISITSIQHHPETQKLSIRVKIFVNDLEESIFQEEGVRLGLGTNTPIENAQAHVEHYLCSKLSISVNDSLIPLNYLNQKVETAEIVEDNVIICQLEAYNISEIVKIKVHNSLLTNAFDSQTNIVNIRANDTKKAINLDKRLPEDQVVFD